jgi:hypothetical protein
MFIPDPDFCPSQIPSPGFQKQQQKIGLKKNVYLFISHKIENYFIFELVKNKSWANSLRIIELFTQKLALPVCSQKYRFGIRDPEVTYSGSHIRGKNGSWIRSHNTVKKQNSVNVIQKSEKFAEVY